jgi:hypothetical protein
MTDGRRNIRTTTPTKVPGLPKPPNNIDRSLRDYLSSVGEALEIRLGRKGDVRDRAVTLRELIDSGLAKELRNKKYDPNNTGNGLNVDFGGSTTFSETPVTPVSFTATVGYSVITLKWEGPFYKYQGHSFTEVWRHTANTLADATLIGSSSNIYFIDAVGSGSATYYYWIRHVSTANEPGPWSNNGVGVSAATATDTNTLLTALSTAITSSQLASSLATPISNLPANTNSSITAVTNTTTALGAQYSVKIQTNSSSGTYISGYGLASETGGNGTTTSSFIVAADRFAVIDPATYNVSQGNGNTTSNITSHVPFSVVGSQTIYVDGSNTTVPGGVYINNAYLNKANIATLLAGSIVGDYIGAAVVMDAPNMHVGTINIGTITKTVADDPRSWTWAKDNSAPNGDRISNFSVDGNGEMQAESAKLCALTIYPTKTDLVNNTNIVFDSNGLDGTYIKDLTVDTFAIKDEAIIAPSFTANTISSTTTISTSATTTIVTDTISAPSPASGNVRVLVMGSVDFYPADSDDRGLTLQVWTATQLNSSSYVPIKSYAVQGTYYGSWVQPMSQDITAQLRVICTSAGTKDVVAMAGKMVIMTIKK